MAFNYKNESLDFVLLEDKNNTGWREVKSKGRDEE